MVGEPEFHQPKNHGEAGYQLGEAGSRIQDPERSDPGLELGRGGDEGGG